MTPSRGGTEGGKRRHRTCGGRRDSAGTASAGRTKPPTRTKPRRRESTSLRGRDPVAKPAPCRADPNAGVGRLPQSARAGQQTRRRMHKRGDARQRRAAGREAGSRHPRRAGQAFRIWGQHRSAHHAQPQGTRRRQNDPRPGRARCAVQPQLHRSQHAQGGSGMREPLQATSPAASGGRGDDPARAGEGRKESRGTRRRPDGSCAAAARK